MKIIDFHTHIYPDSIAQKGTDATSKFYDIDSKLVGKKDVLLEKGKEAGISNFVLLPVATKPEQVHKVNEYSAKAEKDSKEFYSFGTFHADVENVEEEVEYLRRLGLRGIKLHPDIQKFDVDDKRLFKLYDMIQGNLPILFHIGDYRYDFSHPRRLKKILKEFPRLEVIAAHLGGWSIYDEAVGYLKDERCYFDLSSSLMYLSKKRACEIIRTYGADRILFGSDFPMWNPVEEVKAFMELDLTCEEKEKIAYKNAMKILKV